MHRSSCEKIKRCAAGEEVLRYDRVSFQYGKGMRAIKKMSLTVTSGESVAICGPNGSGKTTLLKLASGILLPSSGSVYLGGENIDKKKRKDAFKKIGFLFQSSEDQLFCPTVKEDIAYGPTNINLEKEVIEKRTQDALKLMKIKHLENRPIHHLSGGEKKRVALAGLLVMRPEVIVLDEPTGGLDRPTSKELIKTFRHLNNDHGYTLVVVTHDTDLIAEFAKRIIIMNNGEICVDGLTSDVLTDVSMLKSVNIEAPIITQYFNWHNKQLQDHKMKATRDLPTTLAQACCKEHMCSCQKSNVVERKISPAVLKQV
ncbi:MAG: ABC transporter ATP-binding protein [Bacteriovoracaceae bacterium]|nr:ABC transporter ATP-binding protein [Bacteriovoracaceae bacterium]